MEKRPKKTERIVITVTRNFDKCLQILSVLGNCSKSQLITGILDQEIRKQGLDPTLPVKVTFVQD
jgi:hypothetical protein